MRAPSYRAITAAGLLLAAGAVTAALLRGTEIPFLEGLIERKASEALGRTVTLDGPPRLKLGGTIELRLDGLGIANSDWAGPEPLARLARGEAAIGLPSLFRGPLVIERLLLEGLRVNLATNAAGDSNVPELAQAEDAVEDDAGPPFVLRTATVRDARLRRHNGQSGQQAELVLESLTQREGDDGRLALQGAGTLQGRAWTLGADHSGWRTVLAGGEMSGTVEGDLGDLHLEAKYRLPGIGRLEDLVVDAELRGTVPPEIATLSPLLDTTDTLQLALATSDVDPGISLEATVDVGDVDITVRGTVDHPGRADGLDLSIDADAASLPRLARALDLGAVDELALTIDGRLRRNGARLEIDEFVARAGEHRIEGTILLPELPGTTDAQLDLHARGPDYGFYQRLLRRPFELRAPYALDLVVDGAADGRERVDATLDLGSASLTASGMLGDFPAYTNSQLTLGLRGDDLGLIGRLIERELPALAFAAEGDIAVSDAGRVSTEGLTVSVADAELTLAARFDTYPALDNLDATVRLKVPSLAVTGAELGLEGLGDVPASLELSATGELRDLDVAGIVLNAGESEARSVSGALHVSPTGLESDLRVNVVLAQLPRLLGNLAPEGMPAPRLEFILVPQLQQERYELLLADLRGPQLSGSARLGVGRDLALDETASLTAELHLEDPTTLLPATAAITAPTTPLRLRVDARGGDTRRLDATLDSDGAPLLSAEVLPADAEGAIRMHVRGKGDALRALAASPYLPPAPLAYRVDAKATITAREITLALDHLHVGDSDLSGSLAMDRGDGGLRASLDSRRMDLPPWLQAAREARDDGDAAQASSAQDPRLIPDTALPLALLEGPALDVTLNTGALGIVDPRHPSRLLVDRSRSHLERDGGRIRLRIDELEGSRGALTLDLTAESAEGGARLNGEVTAEELPLGVISVGGYESLPRHTLEARLAGRGSTLRDLAATLDGELLLVGGSGTLPQTSASLVTESFIEQLLLTLLPVLKSQQPSMQVACTVLGARAREGQVTLDPGFVIRTDRVDLSARGEVDLGRERLAIRFDNQARRGLGISAASLVNPYVQITGTLKKPSLGLDVAGSAIAGGAAMATGGLTVIAKPLFGRFLSRSDPCAVALERWEETGS